MTPEQTKRFETIREKSKTCIYGDSTDLYFLIGAIDTLKEEVREIQEAAEPFVESYKHGACGADITTKDFRRLESACREDK